MRMFLLLCMLALSVLTSGSSLLGNGYINAAKNAASLRATSPKCPVGSNKLFAPSVLLTANKVKDEQPSVSFVSERSIRRPDEAASHHQHSRPRFMFCVHGGRVGSAFLAKVLATFPNVTTVHEETFVGKQVTRHFVQIT
eukprot:818526-Prorocentrum_minimum.AAC.7